MQLTSYSDYIHVVIGIVQNTKQQVLVSTRKDNVHQGGLSEFPGGKVEKNETPEQALYRELREEVNLSCNKLAPLIQIPYEYEDRKVFLNVFRVTDYSGSVEANEAQDLNWIDIASLDAKKFPSANYGIIRALQLPHSVCVTPNFDRDEDAFLMRLGKIVKKRTTSIIQLRSHQLNGLEYSKLAEKCLSVCEKFQAKLVLNRELEVVCQLKVNGCHLTSKRLMELNERPDVSSGSDTKFLISASCHNLEEISHASAIGLDYIFLGPVIEKVIENTANNTISNLGWEKFKALAKASQIPIYAIGGLKLSDQEVAIINGAQGIAAIRDFGQSKKT